VPVPIRIVLGAALAAAAGTGVGVVALSAADTGPSARAAPALLPDLEQVVPRQIAIVRVRTPAGVRERLGFASAVENVGAGPLVLEGRRAGATRPEMDAAQVVERADGTRERVERAGRMRYTTSPDHAHWHLLGFDRYELRRASDGRRVVRDAKTGFCLGDRYATPRSRGLPARAAYPAYESRCGLRRPQIESVTQGISVGYGDDYDPQLEGQYLDVTDVPPGRYVLVHRVNADGRLRDAARANDAASALLTLERRAGRARIDVRALCRGTDRCAPSAGG